MGEGKRGYERRRDSGTRKGKQLVKEGENGRRKERLWVKEGETIGEGRRKNEIKKRD